MKGGEVWMSKYSSDSLEAKRKYYRAWSAANREKTREYQRRYWEKRAAREREAKKSEYQKNQIQN